MKKTILHIYPLIFILSVIIYSFNNLQEVCGGVNRWKEKTLTDSLSVNVKKTPVKKTVAELVSLIPTTKIGNKTKRFGEEFRVYSVVCRLKEYLVEDDGDYHIVMVDLNDTTITMIAEIPDPSCESVAKSKYAKNYLDARVEFKKYATKGGKVAYGKYKITGVCFFDRPHGQKGVAKNGIEIHPVLSFAKTK